MIYERLRRPDDQKPPIDSEEWRRSDNQIAWVIIATLVFVVVFAVVVLS